MTSLFAVVGYALFGKVSLQNVCTCCFRKASQNGTISNGGEAVDRARPRDDCAGIVGAFDGDRVLGIAAAGGINIECFAKAVCACIKVDGDDFFQRAFGVT